MNCSEMTAVFATTLLTSSHGCPSVLLLQLFDFFVSWLNEVGKRGT